MSGFEALVPIISGGLSLASSFMGKSKTPAPPPIAKPTVMPIADDEEAKRAKRRALTQQQTRSGRLSTILSGEEEALGG